MTRKMKDSGIEWIGEIPEDWEIKRGKNILKLMKKSINDDDNIITCFRDGEVTLRSNRREDGFTMAEKEIGYQGIDIGDLVIHGMDGFAGAIGISDSRGKGSPVLNVLESTQNKKFIMYYLRNMAYGDVFTALATGIRVRSVDLRWTKLANLPYPIPDKDEQNQIVEFLESKFTKTDDIVKNIKEEIETLENYKKSVITEAVTKGLDKNVEMKDSGIEWIGEIPKHWSIRTIKSITTKSERGTSPSYVDDNTKSKVVNQATFSQGVFDKSNIKYSIIPASQSKGLLQEGDVLLASTGGGVLGKTHYFMENDEYVADGHVTILRTNPAIQNSKILFYIFSTNYDLINGLLAKGSTNQTELQSEWLKSFKVPYAPIEEQIRIVNYLDEKCKLIDDSISIKQKQLETLEEYKKSLIYEYVTGKKEV